MRISDRIVLMQHGEVWQSGDARTLYEKPADLGVARFFCDLNEVAGRVKNGQLATPVGLFAAPHLQEGQAGIAAIRPQSIALRAPGFCLPGRILDRRFAGEVELLDVAVQALEQPLKLRGRDFAPARPGDDVGIDIKAREVLVFAATPA
jgi:iron(III) transport system ATP-binding protein